MTQKQGWLYALYSVDDPNHYRYIGISVDPAVRFRQHRSRVRKGATSAVHCWMRKHGVENIRMSIECAVPIDYTDLLQYERDMIYAYRANGHDLMNLTDGGEGVLGMRHTDESKQRIREAHLGEKNSQYGKKSPETGLRNQVLKTGTTGHWKGRTRSAETRQRMSEANRGRTVEVKINEDVVREIRRLFSDGVMQTKIAESFSISPQLVNNVLKGRRWGWVE